MKLDFDKQRCIEIANTAYRQLFLSISVMEFLSWGVSERTCCYFNDMPTLKLKVNGCLHKGWVYIGLNEGADLYEVRLVNKTQTKIMELVADVYFDNLGRVIDNMVERPSGITDDEYHEMLVKQDCE